MARYVDLRVEISKLFSKNKKLLLVEGVTDPKVYENIISKRIPELDNKVEIINSSRICLGEKINTEGGCKVVLKILEANKSYLDSINNIENKFLAIIDGDAMEYRAKEKDSYFDNLDKYKPYLYRLPLYSIESYAFGINTIESIIKKYSNAQKKHIKDISEYLYNYIIKEANEVLYKLGVLCIMVESNLIDDYEIRYKKTFDDIKNINRIKADIKKEIRKYDDNTFEDFIRSKGIEYNWDVTQKIAKGKHCIKVISLIMLDILIKLNKGSLCENSVLKINKCSFKDGCNKKNCTYKCKKLNGEHNEIIALDIIDNFDCSNPGLNELEEKIRAFK